MSETNFESEDLRKLVGDFGRNVVAPRVMEYDRDECLPLDILAQMAELGFFGGTVAEKWGGSGLNNHTFSVLIEEISRYDHILGVLMSMPSALVGSGIETFGTDEQRERYLAPLARGEIFGGAGVTEPQSGSDVAGMQTTYSRKNGKFIINGAKTWISNLDIANFFVTFATIDPSKRHKGISAFIVPRDTPGVNVNPFKNKLGFRPISTGDLFLDEVELGPENLLGEEGGGFAVAMTAVECGRLAVASRAVGMAQACLEDSVAYARDRIVFGQPIGEFQMIKKKIADMAVEIDAARLLVRRCADLMDSGRRARKESSMAKMYASDVAQRAATEAVQILGATGVSGESRVSRMYRDAKVFQLVEGSNEIHRLLISDYVMGYRTEPA
jgi:hypothetical protein